VPIVLKSGNLNLLEPSGPVQACNGIALPFNILVFPVENHRNQYCEKCVVGNKRSQKIDPVGHKLLGRTFFGEIDQNREKCYEEETNILK
jgi:hypothetical protein